MGNFDKFMDDLEKRQQEQAEKRKALDEAEKRNQPARDRQRKYQEDPHNRTTWSK